MLVFGATILASVFLVLVQQPGRESATWLLYVAAVWALLLPVTSFIQVSPRDPRAAACWTAQSRQSASHASHAPCTECLGHLQLSAGAAADML